MKIYEQKSRIAVHAASDEETKQIAHDIAGWHVLGPPKPDKVIEIPEGAPEGIVAWCVRGKRRAALIKHEGGYILEEFEVREGEVG